MADNPLRDLARLGQSVWLDQLSREWLPDRLRQWIEEDGVSGVTTNPAIFRAAIAGTDAYDGQLQDLAAAGLATAEIVDRMALDDIRAACDVLAPTYAASGRIDGYVSHEVSPHLAYDTAATIADARRLWRSVDRANVLIKIPATREGLPAIRACLAEGININITLMFSLAHYDAVAEAYISALEDRAANGLPLAGIASVASFFVSRVDTHVDRILDERSASVAGQAEASRWSDLRGKAAVANSMLAYERFRRLFATDRFRALERSGAQRQRVLWASTSTKDTAYSDVKYVEELAGPDTVNTLPLSTLDAFRAHGKAADVLLPESFDEARSVVRALTALGIDLVAVGETLSREGVDAFCAAWDDLRRAVDRKRG